MEWIGKGGGGLAEGGERGKGRLAEGGDRGKGWGGGG